MEGAAYGVRVNAVCPGVTNTPMAAFTFKDYANPSDAPFVQQYALKRVAEPREIANAILFLTSDESSYVTGSALAVDGGRCFHGVRPGRNAGPSGPWFEPGRFRTR